MKFGKDLNDQLKNDQIILEALFPSLAFKTHERLKNKTTHFEKTSNPFNFNFISLFINSGNVDYQNKDMQFINSSEIFP